MPWKECSVASLLSLKLSPQFHAGHRARVIQKLGERPGAQEAQTHWFRR